MRIMEAQEQVRVPIREDADIAVARRQMREIGFSGIKRPMDELEVSSAAGNGTSLVIRKWHNDSRD